MLSSKGLTNFGEVTADSGLPAAPIKLSIGENTKDVKGKNHGYGLLHIEASHGTQIRKAGFHSIEEFVENVAENYDTIREGSLIGKKQTYLLEVSDEHNNTLFVQLSRDGQYWNVNSAGIFREAYSRRKPKVASLPTIGSNPSTETAEVNRDHSMDAVATSGNSSTTSADKVTESSEELQGKEDKFTPAPIEDGEDYVDYAARVAAVKAQHDAIKAAENATDTNPTDGQKKAGNYKKGHVQIGVFDISVEQPKGSVRRGKDADGKEWESKMNNTYGYFRGTEGVDGDHIDVFLSNDIDGWNGRKVFVVDQYNPDGKFDEHKVMLGFNDAEDAKSNYLANYEKGWENGRRIEVSTTNLEDFEKWISSSHRKTKPFAEYKGVRIDEVQSPSEKYQPIIQATFNKVKREQGIIEPIAEKQRKPFTVFDITIKDPRRQMYGGVYYDRGMAVATNGFVMFAHKEAYDEAKEGKIITSKGDVIEEKFPDWRGAIPKETIPTGLQTEPLLEFVNGALARMKAEKAKKYEVDGALAYIKFQDGNVVCCQLVALQKMLRAAKSVGADDLRFGTDKEILVAESPAGKAIVAIQGEEKAHYNGDAGYNNFAYEAPTVKGEEEVSDKVQNNEQQVSTDSEERAIIERAKEDGSYMKAPNGEPTRLTENQWAQVRTKAFKSWFGDWENNPSEASKFVDENGEPMVFYHNTNNNFSVFDSKRNGTHTDAGWLGDGFYFYGDENEGSGYGNIKMGVFLNVRDPYYATSEENNQLAEANSRDMSVDFRENLEEEGYDGVFYNGDLRQEAVVFEPNQIKSATDNNGEFSQESDDIRFRQEERAAQELAEVNERFNKELQRYVSGEMDKNEILHLGNPQGVIKEFLPNLPIVMRQRIIKKGSEKRHNVDVAAIMDMPKSLSAPIFVFQRSTDTIGVLTDMKDREGKNVCVAIELNKRIQNGAVHLEVNDVRSFHGREFKNIIEPIVNNRTLMWADKEKGLAYLSSASHQVQQEIDKQVLISAANILKDFENPTIDGKNHIALSENALSAEASHDREAMRNEAVQLSDKLHTPIKIVEDVKDITHSNAEVERRKRNSKGWYDVKTGEVVVVLPNNSDVEDVAATVMHETVAHKGLRELVGEEHYDDFLDEVYKHLRGDLKQGIDAEAGRAFVDDSTKNGERAKSYEQHRRTAVDELFGDMAEKPFEEFSEGERTLWQKLKEVVRKLLDKFLESLKLPKWFELGDNELRYMLWRSKENLRRGKEHPIDMARDMVMREELGLSDAARMRMGDTPDTFKARQRRAVEEKGVVMPGLNSAEVKVVDVPRHSFTGTGKDALRSAERWAKDNITGMHTATNSDGIEFDYNISGKSIEKYVSASSIAKSENLGVHLSVLKKLPNVIANSIEVEEHADYAKDKSSKRSAENEVNAQSLMHRFYGAVNIDGKLYRVKTTIREYADTNRNANAHNYELTKIELLDAPSVGGIETSNRPVAMTSNSSISVAKLLKDVEKSYDSGKKVLDESRKADENPILYRDGEETEDIWKDKSMGLHERTTAAAMRLADKHQENKTLRNDAMRAIDNNLADGLYFIRF